MLNSWWSFITFIISSSMCNLQLSNNDVQHWPNDEQCTDYNAYVYGWHFNPQRPSNWTSSLCRSRKISCERVASMALSIWHRTLLHRGDDGYDDDDYDVLLRNEVVDRCDYYPPTDRRLELCQTDKWGLIEMNYGEKITGWFSCDDIYVWQHW